MFYIYIYNYLGNHDNQFCILEKCVGICGNTLKLIKPYFSNYTQRVQLDNVLSDLSNSICGVPQGSFLRPLKFSLYLFPLSAILKYHKICYHVYVDNTQLPYILGYKSHPRIRRTPT